jgi:hypothetical protein
MGPGPRRIHQLELRGDALPLEMPLPLLARHESVLRRPAARTLTDSSTRARPAGKTRRRSCPLIVSSIALLFVLERISTSQWAVLQNSPHPTRAWRAGQHLVMRGKRQSSCSARDVQRGRPTAPTGFQHTITGVHRPPHEPPEPTAAAVAGDRATMSAPATRSSSSVARADVTELQQTLQDGRGGKYMCT